MRDKGRTGKGGDSLDRENDPMTRAGIDVIGNARNVGDEHPIRAGTDKLDPQSGKVCAEGEPVCS